MRNPERVYTPAEAAAISGIGVKAVHNAIDKRIIEAGREGLAGTRLHRTLTTGDLLRLKLWHGVGSVLAADRRRTLFAEIEASPDSDTMRVDDLLIIDVAEARRQITLRSRQLDEAEAAIHTVKDILGGEPVFKGTRIPVRMIAAMLAEGADEADILEGYPALAARALSLARIWAAAHPAKGRRPRLSEQGFRLKATKRVRLKGDPLSRSAAKSDGST